MQEKSKMYFLVRVLHIVSQKGGGKKIFNSLPRNKVPHKSLFYT